MTRLRNRIAKKVGPLLLLSGIALQASSPRAWAAQADTPPSEAGSTAQAPATPKSRESLRERVEDYLTALLDGERSAMVEVDDYYPSIYLVSGYRIDGIDELSDGSYQVRLRFVTSEMISQNPRGKPKSRRVKARSEFGFSLAFRIRKGYLLWTRKLRTPFVRPGHEKRYLLAN